MQAFVAQSDGRNTSVNIFNDKISLMRLDLQLADIARESSVDKKRKATRFVLQALRSLYRNTFDMSLLWQFVETIPNSYTDLLKSYCDLIDPTEIASSLNFHLKALYSNSIEMNIETNLLHCNYIFSCMHVVKSLALPRFEVAHEALLSLFHAPHGYQSLLVCVALEIWNTIPLQFARLQLSSLCCICELAGFGFDTSCLPAYFNLNPLSDEIPLILNQSLIDRRSSMFEIRHHSNIVWHPQACLTIITSSQKFEWSQPNGYLEIVGDSLALPFDEKRAHVRVLPSFDCFWVILMCGSDTCPVDVCPQEKCVTINIDNDACAFDDDADWSTIIHGHGHDRYAFAVQGHVPYVSLDLLAREVQQDQAMPHLSMWKVMKSYYLHEVFMNSCNYFSQFVFWQIMDSSNKQVHSRRKDKMLVNLILSASCELCSQQQQVGSTYVYVMCDDQSTVHFEYWPLIAAAQHVERTVCALQGCHVISDSARAAVHRVCEALLLLPRDLLTQAVVSPMTEGPYASFSTPIDTCSEVPSTCHETQCTIHKSILSAATKAASSLLRLIQMMQKTKYFPDMSTMAMLLDCLNALLHVQHRSQELLLLAHETDSSLELRQLISTCLVTLSTCSDCGEVILSSSYCALAAVALAAQCVEPEPVESIAVIVLTEDSDDCEDISNEHVQITEPRHSVISQVECVSLSSAVATPVQLHTEHGQEQLFVTLPACLDAGELVAMPNEDACPGPVTLLSTTLVNGDDCFDQDFGRTVKQSCNSPSTVQNMCCLAPLSTFVGSDACQEVQNLNNDLKWEAVVVDENASSNIDEVWTIDSSNVFAVGF